MIFVASSFEFWFLVLTSAAVLSRSLHKAHANRRQYYFRQIES